MPDNKIKIVVTDDHKLFRRGVITALSKKQDLDFIGEAEHGIDLLKKLEYLKPDIVLMGISMPLMNGMQTMPVLRKRFPGLKVIIISMHSDPGVICRMLELGANSYLTKESGSEMIYETILACHKNWFHISDRIKNAITDYKPVLIQSSAADSPHIFTEKHMQILQLLKEGKTHEEIGIIIDLSPRTIAAILDNLKVKTESKTVTQLLEYTFKNSSNSEGNFIN